MQAKLFFPQTICQEIKSPAESWLSRRKKLVSFELGVSLVSGLVGRLINMITTRMQLSVGLKCYKQLTKDFKLRLPAPSSNTRQIEN